MKRKSIIGIIIVTVMGLVGCGNNNESMYVIQEAPKPVTEETIEVKSNTDTTNIVAQVADGADTDKKLAKKHIITIDGIPIAQVVGSYTNDYGFITDAVITPEPTPETTDVEDENIIEEKDTEETTPEVKPEDKETVKETKEVKDTEEKDNTVEEEKENSGSSLGALLVASAKHSSDYKNSELDTLNEMAKKYDLQNETISVGTAVANGYISNFNVSKIFKMNNADSSVYVMYIAFNDCNDKDEYYKNLVSEYTDSGYEITEDSKYRSTVKLDTDDQTLIGDAIIDNETCKIINTELGILCVYYTNTNEKNASNLIDEFERTLS